MTDDNDLSTTKVDAAHERVDLPAGEEWSAVWQEIVERFREGSKGPTRLEARDEIDRGGRGLVLRVRDRLLRRLVAKKVPLRRLPIDDPTRSDVVSIGRFLEEAQVTAQLQHPGIVAVHDLGIDEQGRAFFTMTLVDGSDLRRIFEKVHTGDDGWNETRAVGVLLRVCDTMAYAHAKGVLHRDLKPANIMVGRFGEVYVMDWGLARILDRVDERDLRVARALSTGSTIRSDRRDDEDIHPDSPLRTADGDVAGTPAYMSPEQAEGNPERVALPSDVYAVGAILYELLTDQVPYVRAGVPATPVTIWKWVLEGPPTPVRSFRPDASEELVAICEKAMHRDVAQRYGTMKELGDDLRAYLEGRVVRAHRTGALAEMGKWIQRNRMAACLLGLLFLVAASAGFVIRFLDRERSALAFQAILGWRQLQDERMEQEASGWWPIEPAYVPAMEEWIHGAREAVSYLAEYRRALDTLRRRALPYTDDDRRSDTDGDPHRPELETLREARDGMSGALTEARALLSGGDPPSDVGARRRAELAAAILPAEIEDLDRRIERLTETVLARETWRFEQQEDQDRHDRLADMVHHLETLAAPDVSALARTEQRVADAKRLEQRTLVDARAAWDDAIRSIRDREVCPLYDGLELRPQLGLVPLRRDPRTMLWEFWHVLSGERPTEREDGSWRIGAETGVVLVLVPAAVARVGAQVTDSTAARYDPRAGAHESAVHTIALDPYFIGKYELTQGQYRRATGTNPSTWAAGGEQYGYDRFSLAHPVEQVSALAAANVLRGWSLALPTEAQWEHAARAGTDGVYVTGAAFESLLGHVNFGDIAASKFSFRPAEPPAIDDGYPLHSPVDAFDPNPFGLYGVHGNVWEWTRDRYAEDFATAELEPGDGAQRGGDDRFRMMRGGSYKSSSSDLRIAARKRSPKNSASADIGIRPARAVVIDTVRTSRGD